MNVKTIESAVSLKFWNAPYFIHVFIIAIIFALLQIVIFQTEFSTKDFLISIPFIFIGDIFAHALTRID